MSEEETKPKKLTNKQRIFIDEYLRSFNATRAAIRAGYSEHTAYSSGQRLLKDVELKSLIDARIAESHMGADEALKLLADMARGDIGDLVDNNSLLDLRMAREKGMTKLLRKIKQKTITHIGKLENEGDTEITEIEFEMYSAKDAIDTILKAGGKLNSDINITVTLTDD
jgi:phage terminase small subunit